jgi:hypothetical protein
VISGLTPAGFAGASVRRLALIALGIGVAGVAVAAPFGQLTVALFGCLGLALGLLNIVLLHRSAARFAGGGSAHQTRRSAGGVFGRIALVTVLALAIAWLARPDGLGVFLGLIAFQFVVITTTLVPMVRELRRTGVQA